MKLKSNEGSLLKPMAAYGSPRLEYSFFFHITCIILQVVPTFPCFSLTLNLPSLANL